MFDDLNIKEAAAYLGVNEGTFRKICAKGEGPSCRRAGRTMYFLKETLDAWKADYMAKAYASSSAKLDNKPKARVKKAA